MTYELTNAVHKEDTLHENEYIGHVFNTLLVKMNVPAIFAEYDGLAIHTSRVVDVEIRDNTLIVDTKKVTYTFVVSN